ncbi:hypothetical protein ACFL6S_10015 [Candidatus Poribacteria bacterium]
MEGFPCLETESFLAFVADNSPLGIHRRGYNGIASLIPRQSGNNLFVPSYAGLNYETISLSGSLPYGDEHDSKFEPRSEPMSVAEADDRNVVLVQPETSHAHVSARITFTVEEPHYLHQRIEITFHRRFCSKDEPSRFRSLWASYMHMPPDRHIYLKADWKSSDGLSNWLGITKADHAAREMQVRRLSADHEIDAAQHLDAMSKQSLLSAEELPGSLGGPLAFYYGLCHDSQLFLMMFKQPEQFRLAYSPCGGGKEPAWSPAWDYVLYLDDAQPGTTHVWEVCLVVKKYQSRADVLNEVRRYIGS